MKDWEELIDWNSRIEINKITNSAVVIKYYYRLNHYRKRDCEINQQASIKECPRYSETEIWEYIVQYKESSYLRVEFILEIYKELKKAQTGQIENKN